MTTTAHQKLHTPRHTPGFNQRLETVLSWCGHKEARGRYSLVAKLSGLSHGGAKLLFTDDHPPKQLPVFERLIRELIGLLKQADAVSDNESITRYLLHGHEHNLSKPAHKQASIYEQPNVQMARIYHIVNTAGAELEVNLLNEPALSLEQLEFIYSRIARYAKKNNINLRLDEEKVKAAARKLIELVRDDIIQCE